MFVGADFNVYLEELRKGLGSGEAGRARELRCQRVNASVDATVYFSKNAPDGPRFCFHAFFVGFKCRLMRVELSFFRFQFKSPRLQKKKKKKLLVYFF